MQNEVCPFTNYQNLNGRIPSIYTTSQNGSLDFSWFYRTPKFTTLRVNIQKYAVEDILKLIKHQLEEEAAKNFFQNPEVYIHPILNSCIVVGNLNNCYKIFKKVTAYVIVDVNCAIAVLRGADVYAPGILSMRSNINEGDLVNVRADLDGTCRRGWNQIFTGNTVIVATGIVKMNRRILFKNNIAPKGVAVKVLERQSGVPSLTLPPDTGILQNLPSILCVEVLQLKGVSLVLDMCAAPGNKTTHIASLLSNQGEVIALDKTKNKVSKIESLCLRLGTMNVKFFVYDSTKCCSENKFIMDGEPPFPARIFPRILLDAPCSALGQRPSLRNNINCKDLRSYVKLQKKLLKSAATLLSPGGILVYSTCTLTLEENEEMVAWALSEFKDMKLTQIDPLLGQPGLIESSLSAEERGYVRRFGNPQGEGPEEDTIGFFIAKLIKCQ